MTFVAAVGCLLLVFVVVLLVSQEASLVLRDMLALSHPIAEELI